MALFTNSNSSLERQLNFVIKQRDLMIERTNRAITRAEKRLTKYKAEIKHGRLPHIKMRLEVKRDETKRQLVELKLIVKEFE